MLLWCLKSTVGLGGFEQLLIPHIATLPNGQYLSLSRSDSARSHTGIMAEGESQILPRG